MTWSGNAKRSARRTIGSNGGDRVGGDGKLRILPRLAVAHRQLSAGDEVALARSRDAPDLAVVCPGLAAVRARGRVWSSAMTEQALDPALGHRGRNIASSQHGPCENVHRDYRARVRRSLRTEPATARAGLDRVEFKSVVGIV